MARWSVFKNDFGDWSVLDRGPEGKHWMHYWFDTWEQALDWVIGNVDQAVRRAARDGHRHRDI